MRFFFRSVFDYFHFQPNALRFSVRDSYGMVSIVCVKSQTENLIANQEKLLSEIESPIALVVWSIVNMGAISLKITYI